MYEQSLARDFEAVNVVALADAAVFRDADASPLPPPSAPRSRRMTPSLSERSCSSICVSGVFVASTIMSLSVRNRVNVMMRLRNWYSFSSMYLR